MLGDVIATGQRGLFDIVDRKSATFDPSGDRRDHRRRALARSTAPLGLPVLIQPARQQRSRNRTGAQQINNGKQ
jgi:hypothetical protein